MSGNASSRHKSADRIRADFAEGGVDTVNVWQTVYGDMMTNLMLFFLMMFSLNMVGKEQFEKSAQAFKNTFSDNEPTLAKPAGDRPAKEVKEVKDLNQYLSKFVKEEENVEVIEHGEGVRLRLPEPVLFDLGSAELKDEAKRVLGEIAKGLKNLPNRVVVEGHTDDIPIGRGPYKSNWELSEARAENVANYLIYEEGVPPERVAVAGFGEFWPFVVNDSDLNRALNRRIELLVIADEKEI
ncbi:MAG TPA: flagellar motor protein MotB [Elusimicrobiota bacterium]|nr:flagellar motor protein MotB [Elusimicrobiota bacterium]